MQSYTATCGAHTVQRVMSSQPHECSCTTALAAELLLPAPLVVPTSCHHVLQAGWQCHDHVQTCMCWWRGL